MNFNQNFDQPNINNGRDYQANYNAANYNVGALQITSSSQDFWGDDGRNNRPTSPVLGRSSDRPAGRSDNPPRRGSGGRRPRRRLKRPNLKQIKQLAARRLNLAAKPTGGNPGRRPRKKRTPTFAACISGLICAALVLLTEVGIWGLYCYSRGLPGDTNANASTFMYCFAVFAGCFWAGAVVKRRSLKPVLLLCGVFMGTSLLVSLRLFSLKEFKFSMILLKTLFTAISAILGFVLSLAPYLINKWIKRQRLQSRS